MKTLELLSKNVHLRILIQGNMLHYLYFSASKFSFIISIIIIAKYSSILEPVTRSVDKT